jgi:hypothetical protein
MAFRRESTNFKKHRALRTSINLFTANGAASSARISCHKLDIEVTPREGEKFHPERNNFQQHQSVIKPRVEAARGSPV